jgi:hypothetical protein
MTGSCGQFPAAFDPDFFGFLQNGFQASDGFKF